MKYDFIDFLLSKRLVDQSTVDQIYLEAEESKLGVVALVSTYSNISDTRLAREVAEFYKLPRFNYNRFEVDKVATELVSGIVSVRLGVLPYRFSSEGDLYVVCRDPSLVEGVVRDLEKVVPGSVILEVGPTRAIRELAAFVHYGRSFSHDFDSIVSSEDHEHHSGEKHVVERGDHTEHAEHLHGTADSSGSHTSHKGEHASKKKDSPPASSNRNNDFDQRPSAGSVPSLRAIGTEKSADAALASEVDLAPVPDEQVDVIIDQHLAHLAGLHEESMASMEWEDEDTVVRQRDKRDESLKDFFYQQSTRIFKDNELDKKRRKLLGLSSSSDPFVTTNSDVATGLVDPISEGEFDLNMSGDEESSPPYYDRQATNSGTTGPCLTSLPREYRESSPAFGHSSPDSRTPLHPLDSSEIPSTYLIQLVQHEARIEQLEGDLIRLTERFEALFATLEESGINLSKLKKSNP